MINKILFRSIVWLFLYFSHSHVFCFESRVCSWSSWSSDDYTPHYTNTVKVVEVNCTEGKIDWKHPKGALMVEITPPVQTFNNSTQWKLCIRPTLKYKDVLVSYLENGAPKPLILSKPSTNDVFCVATNWSSLTLYIELKPGSKIYLSRASFYYTVVKNLNSTVKPSDQQRLQCQPCQTKYLLESFCSADLVFKGVLSSNGDDYMRFTIEKFVRKPITDDNNEIFAQSNDGAVKARALVFTPDHCVLSKSVESAEFLVVAKIHLGRAHAICVPLWSDWLNVRHQILVSSSPNSATSPPCDVT